MAPITLLEKVGLGLAPFYTSTAVPPCTTTALALYTGPVPGPVVSSLSSTMPSSLGLFLGVGGSLLVLLVIGILIRFLVRRHRRRRPFYGRLDMESPYYSEMSLILVSDGGVYLFLIRCLSSKEDGVPVVPILKRSPY